MNKKVSNELLELYNEHNKLESILKELQKENDCFEGVNLNSMQLVEDCTVKGNELWCGNKKLAKDGLVDDLYFCNQSTGYCEDDYYGYLYFPIDNVGTYLKMYYEC